MKKPHAPIPDGWNKVHTNRMECVECGQVKPDCNGAGTCWECASTRDVPGVDSPLDVETFDALYDAIKETSDALYDAIKEESG